MNFYLPLFDFALSSATEIKVKTIACIEIPLEWFQNVFWVETVEGQTRYSITPPTEALYAINFAYASLLPAVGGSGAVVPGTSHVRVDAFQYLAKTLLGTPNPNLFQNYLEMLDDMVLKSGMGTQAAPGVMANIKAVLTVPGYSTEATTANIGREINRQMPDSRKQSQGYIVFEENDAFVFNYAVQFPDAPSRIYTLKLRMKTVVNPEFNGIP